VSASSSGGFFEDLCTDGRRRSHLRGWGVLSRVLRRAAGNGAGSRALCAERGLHGPRDPDSGSAEPDGGDGRKISDPSARDRAREPSWNDHLQLNQGGNGCWGRLEIAGNRPQSLQVPHGRAKAQTIDEKAADLNQAIWKDPRVKASAVRELAGERPGSLGGDPAEFVKIQGMR
jgi:hypothetical protein